MKNVILSADGELKVWLVPDAVADSLDRYCGDFSRNWASLQLRPRGGFDETDFIEYLNAKVCRGEECRFVESLGWVYDRKKWPEKYRECPHYNF